MHVDPSLVGLVGFKVLKSGLKRWKKNLSSSLHSPLPNLEKLCQAAWDIGTCNRWNRSPDRNLRSVCRHWSPATEPTLKPGLKQSTSDAAMARFEVSHQHSGNSWILLPLPCLGSPKLFHHLLPIFYHLICQMW